MSPENPGAAGKKHVNLSLDGNLLKQGKDLGLNLSAIAETAIAQAIRTALSQRWLEENAEAIQGYNKRVDAHGVFSDGIRTF
jgi:antitoxin CcdA